MTEFELIERIFAQKQAALPMPAHLIKGIGDDTAVTTVAEQARQVHCIDTLVQGRHFSADWDAVHTLAFAIGYKAVAVNVSDIAAMGAAAQSIMLALALPERLATNAWLTDFANGLFHACQQFGVTLIGGDTTRCDQLVISISAHGALRESATAVYRAGAQPGDKVYVSGTLGDASYALHHPDSPQGSALAHRLHMPTPRLALGQALAAVGASAMIDVSDGLYQDLSHICQQSAVAMRLHLEQLPVSDALASVSLSERLRHQLTGGDDYELLFTLPAHISPPDRVQTQDTPVTCIGEVIAADQASDNDTSNVPGNVSADGGDRSTSSLQPELFYQQRRVTRAQPAPFTTWPDLTGYQHFVG